MKSMQHVFFSSLFSSWTSACCTFLFVISSPFTSLLHYFLYVSPVVSPVIASDWPLLLLRWCTPYPVLCGLESRWRMVIEPCWLFWWFSDFWYLYEIPTHLKCDKLSPVMWIQDLAGKATNRRRTVWWAENITSLQDHDNKCIDIFLSPTVNPIFLKIFQSWL